MPIKFKTKYHIIVKIDDTLSFNYKKNTQIFTVNLVRKDSTWYYPTEKNIKIFQEKNTIIIFNNGYDTCIFKKIKNTYFLTIEKDVDSLEQANCNYIEHMNFNKENKLFWELDVLISDIWDFDLGLDAYLDENNYFLYKKYDGCYSLYIEKVSEDTILIDVKMP